VALIDIWCMAACYSATSSGVPELPFDEATGVIQPAVWQRWLDWDPVRLIAAHPDAARSLRAAYLEGGRRDEYHLDIGAGAVAAALQQVGAAHVRLELFDAGHSSIEYRYPIAARYLAEAMTR
jgi:hypothetical protein